MKRLATLFVDGMGMEHHRQPLVSREVFLQRVGRCIFLAAVLVLVTVSIAAAVYHGMEHESWVDAFLNAVMVMTGLGLVGSLTTTSAKIFTLFYAIISSITFFMVLGILFAPLIHRFLHRFHLELDKEK